MFSHHPEHLYINNKEAEKLVEEVGPHPLREFCRDGGIVILSVWVSCSHDVLLIRVRPARTGLL